MTSNTTHYHAYEPIPVLTAGYQLQFPGLNIIVPRVFINGGSVTVEQRAADKTGNINLNSKQGEPLSVFGIGRVNNYGPGGVCVGAFSFNIQRGALSMAVGGIQSQSLDTFVDAVLDKMYGFATAQFSPSLVAHFNQTHNLSLPAVEKWRLISNETPAVVSFAPNALDAKQATAQAKLPQIFTIAAWQAPDTQHYIIVKGQTHHQTISAFVELVKTEDFNLHRTTMDNIDVTAQLPDYLPYFYIRYWENRFATADKQHLKHLHMCPTPAFNSLILESAVDEAGILFNGAFQDHYIDNAITPFDMQIGILPRADIAHHNIQRQQKSDIKGDDSVNP